MKRFLWILSLSIVLSLFSSCEQPTMLTVNQSSLSFNNGGGSQTVNLIANKDWSASSNQSWCKVSPSSGDGSDNSTFNLSVSCDANTTYDERSCTITIVCEELTSTITVTQAEGKGLLISQPEYNLSNEAQSISVTVQANVQYTVTIDDACKSWIKQESTKGLSSSTIKFAISKNESYDGREGKITIRQTNGNLSATVIVKQSQTNGLFAERTEYVVSYEEQQLNIKVNSNVKYDVQIGDSCNSWISRVQTKGLVESMVRLAIAKNEDVEREGKVILEYGGIEETVRIKQSGGFVEFKDANFKAYCVDNFDKNGDAEISIAEALTVTQVIVNTDSIESLEGVEYFTNLQDLRCYGTQTWDSSLQEDVSNGLLTSLDVSKNTQLLYLLCFGNQLASLDVSKNTQLSILECDFNQLTSLDVSKNDQLKTLICDNNHLTSIDVSKNTALEDLWCNSNPLTSLDVSKNLQLMVLSCSSNQLASLDVSKNTALFRLLCRRNQLTSIDVSKNTQLKELYCDFNQLTSLDVSKNTALTKMWCPSNQLTSIDVSKNTQLEELYCDFNQLTSLDVSKNTALIRLGCAYNQLTTLDVSHNPLLNVLHCSNPNLTEVWINTSQIFSVLNIGDATIKYK